MDYLEKLESTNIIAWVMKHGIKNERGAPITFDKHSFMIDPWLDWTPLQGVRKASQCGWSTMTNFKLFYAAKFGIPNYGLPAANVIYTLPSDSDVQGFVPSKTNLMIQNNPVIVDYMRDESGNKIDVDSIQRKKIGGSMVYFKGTRSKTAALALTADLNIHDESDRSEKFIIDEYESRLATSMYKGRWIFSNPSAPNMPADLLYLDSDQKHWFVKCEHCGHWQYLDWYKLSQHEFRSGSLHCFVDDSEHDLDGRRNPRYGQYVCGKCSFALSDQNRLRGKWVKKVADKEASGYWVTHFMYSWITAKQLLNTERTKSKSYFMNFVRGLPYVGSDVTVDAQTIVNNIVLTPANWQKGKVGMGIDNGDIKHYIIGMMLEDGNLGIFEIGKTKDWAVIEGLINKYEPAFVVDLNPYPNKPRELITRFRADNGKQHRGWASYYIEQSKNYDLVDWGEGDKAHMVYPVRNMLFDELINFIAAGNLKFMNSKPYWEEYISHWETMYRGDFVGTRKAGEISMGEPHEQARGVWLTSTGMDHYCHATLYFYVAMSKIVSGAGQVLKGRQEPIAQIARELGGIPTVPVATPLPVSQIQTIEGVQQPVQYQQPQIKGRIESGLVIPRGTRKSGATSDTL